MRLIKHAVVLITALTATQALSAEHVSTTSDLVKLCTVTANDPHHDAAMGFCLGYIDAALDYHAALTAGPGNKAIACPDKAVTRREVLAVFLAASKSNTAQSGDETPVNGVMRAVAGRWPCSGQ